MGSNSNRHFDKGMKEWGRRPRKEEARQKRRSMDHDAISDSAIDGAPVHSGKRRKKDTKRWCRGKEGREHNYILIEDRSYFGMFRLRQYQCSGCQKRKYERVN